MRDVWRTEGFCNNQAQSFLYHFNFLEPNFSVLGHGRGSKFRVPFAYRDRVKQKC